MYSAHVIMGPWNCTLTPLLLGGRAGSITPTVKIFRGVYGLGKTIEEAKASIVQAMRTYIRECRRRRRPVPRARILYTETVSLAL